MLDTQYTGPICFYCSIVTFNSFGAAIVVEALQAVSFLEKVHDNPLCFLQYDDPHLSEQTNVRVFVYTLYAFTCMLCTYVLYVHVGTNYMSFTCTSMSLCLVSGVALFRLYGTQYVCMHIQYTHEYTRMSG